MVDTLIPGLSDPASVIIFDKFQDVTDLVTRKAGGVQRYDPGKIAVSTRHRVSDRSMGQLMQICGESIEQDDVAYLGRNRAHDVLEVIEG